MLDSIWKLSLDQSEVKERVGNSALPLSGFQLSSPLLIVALQILLILSIDFHCSFFTHRTNQCLTCNEQIAFIVNECFENAIFIFDYLVNPCSLRIQRRRFRCQEWIKLYLVWLIIPWILYGDCFPKLVDY